MQIDVLVKGPVDEITYIYIHIIYPPVFLRGREVKLKQSKILHAIHIEIMLWKNSIPNPVEQTQQVPQNPHMEGFRS